MIDTHTHIYEKEFSDDFFDTVRRAEDAGVDKFVFPAIDIESYDRMVAGAAELEGKAFCCIGLHPTSVKEDWEREMAFVREKVGERRWIAVGEIGLDGHWSREFMEVQMAVFREQMSMAYELNLPVIIHARDATQELFRVLDVLKAESRMPRGVFHAFTGSFETYRRLKSYGGFYFGIGGVVTFKNAQVASAVEKIPLGDLLLETDAPYLAPVPFRGRRNEPSYLTYIAGKIAELKNIDVEEVAVSTSTNAETLFDFDKYQRYE